MRFKKLVVDSGVEQYQVTEPAMLDHIFENCKRGQVVDTVAHFLQYLSQFQRVLPLATSQPLAPETVNDH